jgi:hypothetical protein
VRVSPKNGAPFSNFVVDQNPVLCITLDNTSVGQV